MSRPRRSDATAAQVTVYIDPVILAEMRAAAPKGLGAFIEQLWRERNSSKPARGAPKPPMPVVAKSSAPQAPPIGRAQVVVVTGTAHMWAPGPGNKQQCGALGCGAWRGTPRGDKPCTGA